ncbi:MAG: protein kinase [Planctomycetes bacterium]|nr:protein kinase [Planctomycetota bacterium]
MNGDRPVQQLVDALDLWLAHQSDPKGNDEELLSRHPELRELLEPMLREPLAESQLSPPRMIGEFRILRELGRGGTGVVYEAVQSSLARRVALKVLAAPLASAPQVVARFKREASLLARLSHRSIVPVFEAGTSDGVPYHAMELVDGCTLADVLARLASSPTPSLDGSSLGAALREVFGDPRAGAALVGTSHVDAVLRCVLPIAEALCAAHAQGILHRDVKPANILLRRDGAPLLSDFGLARDADDPSLTRAGDFAGTPHYVSPEQAGGDPSKIDQRTDVFSLAVVIYELLLLERPFDGDTTAQVLERVRQAEPRGLRHRNGLLPEDLACVLDMALQKDPDDRYASMAEFEGELRAVLELRPVRARRRGPVSRTLQAMRRQPLHYALFLSLALGLPALIGLGAYVWSQRSRIAAASAAERLPAVERLLETMLLQQDYGGLSEERDTATAALTLLPDLPEALAAAYQCESLAGEVETAKRHLSRLFELAPEVAAQMKATLPEKEPESALAWFVRGMRLIDQGHDSGNLETFRAAAYALRRAMDRADSPRSIFHCQHLHALMHVRDRVAIRELTADVRHRWPDSPFAAYWCGFALIDIDSTRAAAELQRAIDLAPHLPQPYARLARVRELEGQITEAEALYRRAGELAPGSAVNCAGLSRVLGMLGRRTEALAAAESAIELRPDQPMSHAALGLALAAVGREADALAALAKAIELGPHSASPLLDRARLHVRFGRYAEALADADRAVALEPDTWHTHSVRGMVLLNAQRPAEAATAFERVIAVRADLITAWRGLAQARRRSGDFPGSRAAIDAALRLQPDDGITHLELGKLLRAEGRREEATSEFEKAIEQRASVAEALVNLAGLRAEVRDFLGAVQKLAEARQADPGLREAWLPAFGYLELVGRREEAIALRAEFVARQPREIRVRVDLCRAVLALNGSAPHVELLRRTLDELQALGVAERCDVLLLRAELAEHAQDHDAARKLLRGVIDSTTSTEAQRSEALQRLDILSR